MTLVGKKIGHYQVQSAIGAGGMGEVFLAEDTRLDRKVALKILPAEVANNKDRMQRFVREAKSASVLNHPHIAHIYEIGESNGVNYIAMEYVEGATLRAKIDDQKTDLRTFLKYLAQVADGLAKAHQAGIVHRDLKPENIMISGDGYAKILDFGLAKLVENKPPLAAAEESEESPTAIMPEQLSAPGLIMGTAGYMSPEQAQGKKEIDQRSDIFSFGCVLFEAATGRAPFAGDSVIDTLHKIIKSPAPPIRDFNPRAPADLQRIVRRCLQKDPEERFQTIKDAGIEIKELRREMTTEAELEYSVAPQSSAVESENATQILAAHLSANQSAAVDTKETGAAHSTSSAEYIASEVKKHKTGAALALLVLALITAGAGYAIYKYTGSQKTNAPSLSQMKLTRLTTSGKASSAAISPDGKYVVYSVSDNGQQSLWMRHTATQSNVQIVPPADVQYARLIFSPDGNYLFYTAAADRNVDTATLYQIPILGGSPRKLLSNISSFMALSPDASQIVFKREFPAEGIDTLIIANVDGTNERRLAVRKMPESYFEVGGTRSAPAWSPDGKTIACRVATVDGGVFRAGVVAIDAASGQETPITSQNVYSLRQMAWLNDQSGLIILAADQLNGAVQLWHLSYPAGEMRRITNDLNDYRSISLTSNSDSAVTVQRQQASSIWVAPSNDAAASAKQITNGADRADYIASWTPDNKLVFTLNANGARNIWITDADGANQKQLTTEDGLSADVSPDGRTIAFRSDRTSVAHIFRMDADGGNVKQLTNGSGEFVPVFSPDGKWVLYNSRESGRITLWRVSADGGEPQQLTTSHSYDISVSPDGKWLTANYREDTPNAPDKLAVFPFEGGQPVKIFDNIPTDGQNIHWTPDSRAFVYINTRNDVSNLWMQPFDGGAPKQLTDFKSDIIYSFDYSRDGKQLAVSRGTINSDVVLISNFK